MFLKFTVLKVVYIFLSSFQGFNLFSFSVIKKMNIIIIFRFILLFQDIFKQFFKLLHVDNLLDLHRT